MTTTDKERVIGCCWKCQGQVYYDCKDPSCECHKEKADTAYSGSPMFKGIPNPDDTHKEKVRVCLRDGAVGDITHAKMVEVSSSDDRGWEAEFYDLTKTMDGLYRPQLKLLIESLLQQERAKGQMQSAMLSFDKGYKVGKKELVAAVEEYLKAARPILWDDDHTQHIRNIERYKTLENARVFLSTLK